MFTGLVAGIGRLVRSVPRGRGLALAIEHHLAGEPPALGESVAVDGCCLTVVASSGPVFEAELSPETLDRTGGRRRWRSGRRVNLERALKVGDRLHGHLVQGHVDTLARIVSLGREGDGSVRLGVERPASAGGLLVEKGSVTLDGVSLTIAGLDPRRFEVALIPATLAATTLGEREVGDEVTVEYDVLGKYVQAALDSGAIRRSGVPW
ncbi:MAG: riboflavin synthase [Acidobacteriota bacterium]|nr:riboflavin synthase [Acidobacteriota bacterium]MDQ7086819.1 riboflavin synthase [Acidobacteriota bacterium]